MPFFKSVKKQKIRQRRVSLQVQKSEKKKIKLNKNRKRAYPFVSYGSITIEAAISMTLFSLVMIMVLGFIVMINTQLKHQIKNNNIAMGLAKARFVENEIRNDEENRNDEIDMIMAYSVNIPFINKKMHLTQRCLLKDWSGTDITMNGKIVYITKNGKVYHTTRECSHLAINIRKSYFDKLGEERNCYGQKYYKCSICVADAFIGASEIFLTEDGDKYHTSLMCSGLIRTIIEIDKNKVKDLPPCSGCAK